MRFFRCMTPILLFSFCQFTFVFRKHYVRYSYASGLKKNKNRNQVNQRLWEIERLSEFWCFKPSPVCQLGWIILTQQITKSRNCRAITDGSWEVPRAAKRQVTLVSLSRTSSSQSCRGVFEAYTSLISGPGLGVLRKRNTWLESPLKYILSANKWACSRQAQSGQFDSYKELLGFLFLDALPFKIAIKYP